MKFIKVKDHYINTDNILWIKEKDLRTHIAFLGDDDSLLVFAGITPEEIINEIYINADVQRWGDIRLAVDLLESYVPEEVKNNPEYLADYEYLKNMVKKEQANGTK